MLSFALAYHTDNQSAANQIIDDLGEYFELKTFAVGAEDDEDSLAEKLAGYSDGLVLLISPTFLQSALALYELDVFLADRVNVLPVLTPDRVYDPELGENVSEPVAPYDEYTTYWSEELQSAADQNDGNDGDAGRDRISAITHSIQEVFKYLSRAVAVSFDGLSANSYQLLFETFEAEDDWRDFSELRGAGASAIPGFDLLSTIPNKIGGADAGAKKVGKRQVAAGPTAIPEIRLPLDLPVIEETDQSGPDAETGLVPNVDADAQAEQLISRAWELYENERTEESLGLLATGKESLPDHPDIAYNYALMIAMDTEMPQAALLELEKLLNEFHDHAGALYLSGELSVALGNYESAYLDWLQLADADPRYPELNYRLGVLIDDHIPERSAEALTFLRRASRDEPVNGDARYRYAMLRYQKLGSPKKAIKWLKRAIEADPDHAAAHYALALMYHKRSNSVAARDHFQTAVRLEPAYDTDKNRRAFTEVPTEARDRASVGKRQVSKLENRVRELQTALAAARAGYLPTSSAPASAPMEAPGKGKTVFISGATSGIGRATAYALAADGYELILLGRRTEHLEEIRTDLRKNYGNKVITVSADVRQRAALQAALNGLPEGWRKVDVLINNAGKAKGFDPIHEGDYAHWDEMIDVNLKGLLTLTREITPWMVERGAGTIVNVCSTAGKEVYANGNVYCATKHAVDALTYAMRLDLVKHGIRVGQICPAHVEETEFAVVRFDGDRERAKIYQDFQPLRSRDVAESIRFMLNQPPHVNIMDVVLQGTQQASSTVVDRSGRDKFKPT